MADYSEVRDGTGGQRLQFACFPVSAVLCVTIDGIVIPPVSMLSPNTVSTSGYAFSPTQLVVRGYRFVRGPQNIAFSYTAGYSTIPPELAQACIELVALRYRDRLRVGEISKAVGGGETISYSQKDMSAAISTVLQQYRAVAPIGGNLIMMAPTATDASIVGGVL